uniref:Uncharacterized protein n=1 Tax=Pristionchus pacificus TaxID=54126 RepID=A0A2A6C708_PRIPA|eukprot:PDM73992.1 hypothetical protein PRIPAC_41348 [Pristionchus pacificus]
MNKRCKSIPRVNLCTGAYTSQNNYSQKYYNDNEEEVEREDFFRAPSFAPPNHPQTTVPVRPGPEVDGRAGVAKAGAGAGVEHLLRDQPQLRDAMVEDARRRCESRARLRRTVPAAHVVHAGAVRFGRNLERQLRGNAPCGSAPFLPLP